jgi:hypothetical protein
VVVEVETSRVPVLAILVVQAVVVPEVVVVVIHCSLAETVTLVDILQRKVMMVDLVTVITIIIATDKAVEAVRGKLELLDQPQVMVVMECSRRSPG